MLERVKRNQNEYKSGLNETKNRKNKSKKQKSSLYNIETLYKSRNKVIKFFNDYSSMVYEATFKVTHEKGLKISTPKQMLQDCQ